MDPTERAQLLARRHHDLLGDEPGLAGQVRAVWLTGSAMLADLTAGRDVDTVTVTDAPLGAGVHPALARVHDRLAAEFPGVRYDTTYLSLDALARPPEPDAVVPHSRDGRLVLDQPCGEVHAVTWWCLPHALPVAGLSPEQVSIAADRDAALAHSRDTLGSSWAPTAEHVAARLADALHGQDRVRVRDLLGWVGRGMPVTQGLFAYQPGDAPPPRRRPTPAAVGRWAREDRLVQRLAVPMPDAALVEWLVLGPPRLTGFVRGMPCAGPVPSKSEAAPWLARWMGHADLVARALASRRGEPVGFTRGDALEAVEWVRACVRWGQPSAGLPVERAAAGTRVRWRGDTDDGGGPDPAEQRAGETLAPGHPGTVGPVVEPMHLTVAWAGVEEAAESLVSHSADDTGHFTRLEELTAEVEAAQGRAGRGGPDGGAG